MIDDGHLFMVTRPAETAAVIEAFLADASKRVEPSSPLSRMANWVGGLVSTFGGRRDAQSQQEGKHDGGHDHVYREPHERGY
jgi:hypothetical protein